MHTTAKILAAIAIVIAFIIIVEVTKERMSRGRISSIGFPRNAPTSVGGSTAYVTTHGSGCATDRATDDCLYNEVPDDFLDDIAPREKRGAVAGCATRYARRVNTDDGMSDASESALAEMSQFHGERTESALWDAMGIETAETLTRADESAQEMHEFWAQNGYLYKEMM